MAGGGGAEGRSRRRRKGREVSAAIPARELARGRPEKGEKENRGWKQWVEGDKLYLVSLRVPLAPLYSAFVNCWFTSPCTLTRKMALPPPLSTSQTSVVIQLESHSFLAQGTPGGTLYGYFCEWLQLKGKFKMLS